MSIDEARLLASLRRMIAIPSTNPGAGEQGVAGEIASQLAGSGAAVHAVETLPGRPSLAAVIDSGQPGPCLVLNGHMDTVPIGPTEEWSVDPYGAEIRDGRVYGRGACDMKAGLATQIEIARALAGAPPVRGRLILHFAIGEETGDPGTASLIAAGFGGDFGVVTEPTSLQVAVAQRGLMFVRVVLRGRGGHASDPAGARNPIAGVPLALAGLEQYLEEVADRRHPLLAPPTCTPTVIAAGGKPNVIPTSCELLVDRRLLPGESPDAELVRLRVSLETALRDADLELVTELAGPVFEPSETEPGSDFVAAMLDSVEAVTGRRPTPFGTPYATDVRNLVLDGRMEAVTFGPGSIEDAHRSDESVTIADLSAATHVLLALVRTLLG